MNMYEKGFIEKCAELGINPQWLAKQAQLAAGAGRLLGSMAGRMSSQVMPQGLRKLPSAMGRGISSGRAPMPSASLGKSMGAGQEPGPGIGQTLRRMANNPLLAGGAGGGLGAYMGQRYQRMRNPTENMEGQVSFSPAGSGNTMTSY
jgi:hypothetical protein